eukprot:m.80924 g.80924  ORF g.80924 m.80924 type:complete len:229 (+) comp12619_c1_seq2:162-848(+)
MADGISTDSETEVTPQATPTPGRTRVRSIAEKYTIQPDFADLRDKVFQKECKQLISKVMAVRSGMDSEFQAISNGIIDHAKEMHTHTELVYKMKLKDIEERFNATVDHAIAQRDKALRSLKDHFKSEAQKELSAIDAELEGLEATVKAALAEGTPAATKRRTLRSKKDKRAEERAQRKRRPKFNYWAHRLTDEQLALPVADIEQDLAFMSSVSSHGGQGRGNAPRSET